MKLSVALALVAVLGCSSGQNVECRWPAEAPRVLDLHSDRDATHLMQDVELAEELSVRFADASGAGPGPARRRIRVERCYDPLIAGIIDRHGVSRADVDEAKARIGERGLNLIVNVPVMVLFVVLTAVSLRGIRRRFAEERGALVAASAIAAVGVAGLTTGFGRVWQMLSEAIRIGNGHLGGTRGMRLPWVQHSFEYFLVVLVAFVLVALVFHSRSLRSTMPS